MEKVSFVIITRNRAALLSKCLNSLIPQLVATDEVLIVDNNSTDKTLRIVEQLQKHHKKQIRYSFVAKQGISRARNIGIREAKNSWVAFVDDDCIASLNWSNSIRESIALHPQAAAIIGPNMPLDSYNPYSRATAFFYDFWLLESLQDGIVYNPEILDAKNLILNRNFLTAHYLLFDEELPLGEDCDLGIQIEKARGQIVFNPRMSVRHRHPTTLRNFLIKQISYSISSVQLLTKWYPRITKQIDRGSMIVYYFNFYFLKKKHKLGNIKALTIICLVALTNKLLFFFCRFVVFKKMIIQLMNPIINLYTDSSLPPTTKAKSIIT